MSLFEGSPIEPVELEKKSVTKVPDYLTNYLTALSSAGTGQLGGGKVAALPGFLQSLMSSGGNQPNLSDLTRYQTTADEATRIGGLAEGIEAADISKFYDPYQQQVIDEMQRQSDINVQRNVIPALRALGMSGAGGAAGTRRGYDISGQALADIASQLQTQQTCARSAGFKQALEAALREQATQQGLVGGLSSLANVESSAAPLAVKAISDLGKLKLDYDQAAIEAPLKRVMNVAEVMRGYTYPTTIEETKEELPSIYQPSELQQIAGLGTLVGAAIPALSSLGDWIAKKFPSTNPGDTSTDSSTNPSTYPPEDWT